MFLIKKATTADIPLINKLAWNVFPETYKDILSHEQIEYMMDWMYSIENLHKQMEKEGHIYYIAYAIPMICFLFCAYYGWKGYKVID